MIDEKVFRQFFRLAKETRQAQKTYFKERHFASTKEQNLRNSKALEDKLDQAILELEKFFPEQPVAPQGSLFDATKPNSHEKL